MRLVFDVETDGLENYTQVWCAVAFDLDSDELFKFGPGEIDKFLELMRDADEVIGHNIIGYDLPVLHDLLGLVVHPSRTTDTLILGHLLRYTIDNGHSLDAWGERFKVPKVGKDVDFSKYSPEILERCVRDVEITVKLYRYLVSKLGGPEWKEAIDVEHKMAWVCQDMHDTGFSFDHDTARLLYEELRRKVDRLDEDLRTAFPPKLRPVREITPKATKHGTISKANLPRDWIDLSNLSVDSPFTLCTSQPFNAASPKQVVERLNEVGWKPTEKTKGHEELLKKRRRTQEENLRLEDYKKYGWKINETNLATLPDTAPHACHSLVERIMLGSRLRTLEEWFKSYDAEDGKVHGRFNSIGTWTHRMSHRAPNMGNIAARKSIKYAGSRLKTMALDLGTRMRQLWGVTDDNYWLVGTDASGIQLRIFAHYVNDPVLTEAVVSGDPHQVHADILGISRDDAKTFIYAFLLGAGDAKIGEIVGGNKTRGAELKQQFIEAYPGLTTLRNSDIPRDADRRYFEGLDGRLVFCDNAHLVLAGYLQNGEATIMKHANLEWRQYAARIGVEFKQVNFVHDEWQTEVMGSREEAELLGKAQVKAIEKAGRKFNLRCPLTGEYRLGKNWLETH